VQHVPEQHQETGTMQPVATKSSVGSKGDIGIVIHLLKTKEKWINILSIGQRQPPTQYNPNEKVISNCTADRFLVQTDNSFGNPDLLKLV
jgi:hypothetical protein